MIFIIFGAFLLFQVYMVWLVIDEFDKRMMRATSTHIEMDKYFDLMIDGYGMSYHDAKEEYDKIETYSHLLRINKNMEKHIKKEKVYA